MAKAPCRFSDIRARRYHGVFATPDFHFCTATQRVLQSLTENKLRIASRRIDPKIVEHAAQAPTTGGSTQEFHQFAITLTVGIYECMEDKTPGVGVVLDAAGVASIPEAHAT